MGAAAEYSGRGWDCDAWVGADEAVEMTLRMQWNGDEEARLRGEG